MNALILTTVLLALAWFTATNLLASALAWIAGAVLRHRAVQPSAGALLAVRLFPAAASLLSTFVLFVPVHWTTEARGARESFGWILVFAAIAGALLLVRSLSRALAIARADRRLRAIERASAIVSGALESPGVSGMALAGVVRTRVVIDPRVAAALTAPELDVAIAHELAHRRAVDNVKRWACHCAPDFFGMTRTSVQLERAWHAAAESLADARAAREDDRRAVDLASALVKVARLTTPASGTVVWSTFNDPALLSTRVHQLASGAPLAPRYHPIRTVSAAIGLLLGIAILSPVLAQPIHALTEAIVALLP